MDKHEECNKCQKECLKFWEKGLKRMIRCKKDGKDYEYPPTIEERHEYNGS